MNQLRVMTWNVLHRIHAVNWQEAPLASFPDERIRIAGIAALIAGQLEAGVDVVCLQEVSGDQRARLVEVLGGRGVFFAHCYPRVPALRIKTEAESPLTDPSEYLLMIVSERLGRDARQRAAATFPSDFGKGYLAVDLPGGILAVDTHVSWGERGAAQLDLLARTASGPAFIIGDFNAEVADVTSGFHREAADPTFFLSDLTGQRHTRIATIEKDSHTIDHIVVRQGRILSATVLDCERLSDHNPVLATLQFPS